MKTVNREPMIKFQKGNDAMNDLAVPQVEVAKRDLCGPMIPVITNLQSDLSIDHAAIRDNVQADRDRGIEAGHGVFLAGGAGGDFPMLTVDERKAVAQTIVQAADGRTPVLIGAQDTNPDVCIDIARWAEEIGAYGIQLSPTYYYASSPEDCWRLFEAVHGATEHLSIMIYNTHWEGYDLSISEIERLAELPRCVSLKWSSPNTAAYLRVLHRFSDRFSIVDNQGLPVMNHLLGGTGYITHLATLWPEHDLEVWSLLQNADYAAAQTKLAEVNWPWQDFRGKMWERTAAESPVVKAGLELLGRPGGPCRGPTRELTVEERDELRQLLLSIGVPGIVA